jgi:methionine-rich copper-binding protein CopC
MLAPLFAVLLLAAPLFAHMKVVKSSPAAGGVANSTISEIQISFSEEPDLKLSKLELTGPSGTVKLSGVRATGKVLTATIDAKLAEGSYTLHWQSAGDDGHVQKGDIAFKVSGK